MPVLLEPGKQSSDGSASDATKGELMYSGCICCYSAFNFDKIFVLCKGSSTCICVEQKQCLAAGEPTFPVGLIQQEGFICKLGLPCCTYGLKMPDTNDLISSDAVCLCARSVAQFPFGDKISKPVCAVCFVQLLPEFGFMKPGPGGTASGAPPEAVTMER